MVTPNTENNGRYSLEELASVNQRVAMSQTLEYVHDMTLPEVFIYMKMLEGMAAQCSLIYNQRLVRDKIVDPKEIQKNREDWQRAVEEQNKRNAPPIVRKQLSARDKAVKSLMDIGLSRADAESSVDAKFAAQGKATGNTYGQKSAE